MFYLTNFDPNNYDKEEMGSFSTFLRNVFVKDEIVDIVTKTVTGYYHPGMVLYQVRVFNSNVTYFVSLFPEYFTMLKGIIINTKFIGDIKKIYPDVKFNQDTGAVEDELVEEKTKEFITSLKKLHRRKLRVFQKDGIIVLASKDELVINDLSTYNLNVEDIPEYYFDWEKNGKLFFL